MCVLCVIARKTFTGTIRQTYIQFTKYYKASFKQEYTKHRKKRGGGGREDREGKRERERKRRQQVTLGTNVQMFRK